jgi:hypothetical protein
LFVVMVGIIWREAIVVLSNHVRVAFSVPI